MGRPFVSLLHMLGLDRVSFRWSIIRTLVRG